MFQHNVLLQRCGDKVCMVTILPAELFKDIPEDKLNQCFVMAHTTQNIYTNMLPSIQLDTRVVLKGDDWAKQCKEMPTLGLGIDGIITGAYWFINHRPSIMNQLMGDKI